MSEATLLIVDDAPGMRRMMQLMLEGFGHRALAAGDAEEALTLLARERVDMVFTDLQLPGASGLDLLERVRGLLPDVPVVVITAFATIETAVRAVKLGAFDYLVKPFRIEEIEALVAHALALRVAERENAYLREIAAAPFEGLVGSSAAMRQVYDTIARVAPSPTTVLITGETGTGKELVARAVHARSDRADRLFVPINCAAIPSELLEAELFGVTRGAFTGATRDRPGKFELADGGTLFLDEIGDMPLAMQAKLLRVLQERTVERLGSGAVRHVDVRLLAATHRDLDALVERGGFRSDLYYRLAVVPISLPPLRERREDIRDLTLLAVGRFARRSGREIELTSEALDRLTEYHWPGNVRELYNVLERAVLLSNGTVLDADAFDDLPPSPADAGEAARRAEGRTAQAGGVTAPDTVSPLATVVARAEREAIQGALAATADNKTRAAELLGVSVRTLWYKIQKLGIATPGE